MSDFIVVNFDRKQYIRPSTFGERGDLHSVVSSHQGVLTALIVLLSDGNGRGGGDLRADEEEDIVGSWKGGRIAIIDETAIDADLSEPGMENIPLQEQIISVGKDISATVYAAIDSAERGWTPSYLNPRLKVSMYDQREMVDKGRTVLMTRKSRDQPLLALEHLFAALDVETAITPYSATKQIQAGLDRIAELFGCPERWTVNSVRFTNGLKMAKTSYYSRELSPVQGVQSVAIHATSLTNPGQEVNIVVKLDQKGTTATELLKTFFPNIEFDLEPDLISTVHSPEVAKLLSLIPNLGA